jgi:hypothetical protein
MPARLHDHLFDASGGLIYHLRALVHRKGRWAPFHHTVADWLTAWQPQGRELLLVGPSAGYSLPAEWLARFERITALEPDPLARLLLGRRVAAGKLRFARLDCLAGETGLKDLAAAYPFAAILFCNVLGQIAAPKGRRWDELLAEHLRGHQWASYHDAVSTLVAPRQLAAQSGVDAELPAVLAKFWAGGELPLVDHDTFRLAGPAAHRYALWPISAGRWHLV